MLIIVYCILIVVASFAGGWLPSVLRFSHSRLHLLMSFVAGLMLGVGLLHMLPHSVAMLPAVEGAEQPLDRAIWWMLVGLIGMFFLIRAFHFHQHGSMESNETLVECDHNHNQDHEHHHVFQHKLSWTGIGLGLALHTLIDGMALAASVRAESIEHTDSWIVGAGTFLAILLHKPLDAMSITSLMTASGWSRSWMNWVNGVFAVMAPLGVLIFFGVGQVVEQQNTYIGCALALSAGVFLCIALGDLLPEIQFHSHDRIKLSASLLVGLTLAYAIKFIEPDHMHSHDGHRGHSSHVQPPLIGGPVRRYPIAARRLSSAPRIQGR